MRERQRELGEHGQRRDRGARHRHRRRAGRRGEGLPRRRPGRCARSAAQAERPGHRRRRARHRPAHARRVGRARGCSRRRTPIQIDTTDLEVDDVVDADRGARPRALARDVVSGADVAWAVGRVATIGLARRALVDARPRVYGVDRVPRDRRARARGQPLLTGSTRRSSAPPRPRNIYFVAKVEAHRIPGPRPAHPLLRRRSPSAAASPTATRCGRCARSARDGRRARPLRRGHAPAERPSRATAQPGAAMVALQEDVPVVPVAIYGTQFWRPGNFAPSRSRSASRCASTACRRAAAATRRRPPRSSAEIQRLFDWLADVHARGPAARVDAAAMTPSTDDVDERREPTICSARSRSSASRTSASRRSSTGSPRRAPPSCTRRSGTTRDRKELLCEWNGKHFLLIDTGGVDIADPTPDHALDRRAGARGDRRGRPRPLRRRRARRGSRRATRSSPRSCARRRRPCSCSRTRSTTRRRTTLALEFHRLGLGDPFPLSALHGSDTGDLLDEVLDRLPGRSAPDGRRATRSASRSSAGRTSASRRS